MPTQELNKRRNTDVWLERAENEPETTLGLRNSRKYLGQAASALEQNAEVLRRVEARAERYRLLVSQYLAPDPYVSEILRTAKTKADRERLERLVDTVAAQLKLTRNQLKDIALAEFIEKHDESLKDSVDTLRADGPFWEISEYTEEEFNAFMEADQWTPELAERYKDLLED